MRSFFNQQSFNYGQLGKLMAARSELKFHKKAGKTVLNFRPTVQGPLIKRKGTIYAGETKDSTKASRLIKFIFSEVDSYVLEFGDLYIRFWQTEGAVLSGMSPYEIVSPYSAAQVKDLKFAQLGNIMYIAHPSFRPYKLTRSGATNWTIAALDNKMGPVEDVNETATTITLTGTITTGGTSTWTASASIFQASHVGSVWAIANTSNASIGYARMASYTSGTEATFENQTALFATATATVNWYEASWSGVRGYPRAVAFHEQRLFFGGTNEGPLDVFGSVGNGAYENFDKGTAADDDALKFTLTGRVNTIQWMISDGDYLVAGTFGGLAFVGATNRGAAFTPTNVKTRVGSSFGASVAQGVQSNNAIVYAHSNTKSIYKAEYDDISLNYSSLDLTDFAPDILGDGSFFLDTVEQPDQTIITIADGKLKCLSYDESQGDGTIPLLGWYNYDIGGTIESVATVPTTGDDRIWVIVNRTIDGATVRNVEYFYIGDNDIYVDSAVVYSGSATRSFSGLDHLEGETVSVWGDGSYAGDYEVTSGAITIPDSKTAIEDAYIGLSYNADWESMTVEVITRDGVMQSQKSRINELQIKLLDTLGLSAGPDVDNLKTVPFRNVNSQMTTAQDLFGAGYPEIKQIAFNGTWTREPRIYLRSNLPFPCTIISVVARMELETQ